MFSVIAVASPYRGSRPHGFIGSFAETQTAPERETERERRLHLLIGTVDVATVVVVGSVVVVVGVGVVGAVVSGTMASATSSPVGMCGIASTAPLLIAASSASSVVSSLLCRTIVSGSESAPVST